MLFSMKKLLASDWGIYAARGGVVGANFLSLLVIAYLMEPGAFGRYAFMWALAMTLSAVVSLGAPSLLLRDLSAYQAPEYRGITRRHALRLVLVWPAALTGIAIAALIVPGPALMQMIGKSMLPGASILRVAAAAYALNVINVLVVIYRITGHPGLSMALRDAGPQSLMMVGALGLAAAGALTPETLFTAFLVLAAASILICLIALRRKLAQTLAQLPQRHDSPVAISVSGFWGSTVVSMIWTQIDILLAAIFLPATSLGHYQVLKRIANLAGMPVVVANWAVVVKIGTAFARGDRARIQALCVRAIRLSLVPLLGLIVLTLLAMPLIIESFDISDAATPWLTLAILLAGSAINVLFGTNFLLAAQCRLEKTALLARVAGIVATSALTLALARYGVAWVAFSFAAGVLLSNLAVWARVRARLGVDTSLAALLHSNRTAIHG